MKIFFFNSSLLFLNYYLHNLMLNQYKQSSLWVKQFVKKEFFYFPIFIILLRIILLVENSFGEFCFLFIFPCISLLRRENNEKIFSMKMEAHQMWNYIVLLAELRAKILNFYSQQDARIRFLFKDKSCLNRRF